MLRSDAYELEDDGALRLAVRRAPLIDLDPAYYKTMADFDARFPHGPPSLREASSLTVKGDWTFGKNVVVRGTVVLQDDDGRRNAIANGTMLDGVVMEG